MPIHTNEFSGRAYVTYVCTACGKDVDADDAVWVNPDTGEATTGDNGKPYHVDCAPPEHDDGDDGYTPNAGVSRKERQDT